VLGPSLEEVCRALIQSVRGTAASAAGVRPVLVAMHTSIDIRQATTEPHPGDPALLTFPCVLIELPSLVEDLERRRSRGFAMYRQRDKTRLTMIKEPYPHFYDLMFTVRIEAERLTGEAGLLALVQTMTAWGQEGPRIAGLMTDWRTTFVPDQETNPGDIAGATGHIRLRDWPCYGGPAEVVKLIAAVDIQALAGSVVEGLS
jgi:hypothetical protein